MKRLIICLLVLVPTLSKSQFLDFDSLYDNNPAFKAFVEFAEDTFSLFSSTSPLEFNISGNLNELVKERMKENEYQWVTVFHDLNDSIRITREVRAKARGNFRLKYCKYPPVRLNFKKTEFKISQLQDLDKMKMVVRCRNQAQYEQYLFTEYLAYRILNVLTDFSFKPRLIKMNITDTGGRFSGGEAYAFIIETNDQLKERLKGKFVKDKQLHPNLTHYEYANLMAVYQYMIGNTDWSIPGNHNVKILKTEDEVRPYAIPFDFDHAGIVDAEYANPNESLPIDRVTQRLFRGMCRTPDEFQRTFNIFRDRKEKIYALLDEIPQLREDYRKKTLRYLDQFYKNIADPRMVQRDFIDTCRK